LIESFCVLIVPLVRDRKAEIVERQSDAQPVAKLSEDRQALLMKASGGSKVALFIRHTSQVMERPGNAILAPYLLAVRQALLKEFPVCPIVALLSGYN